MVCFRRRVEVRVLLHIYTISAKALVLRVGSLVLRLSSAQAL